MSTTISALSSPNIRWAEFVRLTVGKSPTTTTYTFCNSAAPITVGGITFTNLGSLLSISNIQQDLKSTSADLAISLTGINPENVGLILSSDIKGSLVEVWRGFMDADNQIITTPTTQFFKRYQGIIANVSITENWDQDNRSRTATCMVSCSSMRRVLENLIGGVKTNQTAWQVLYPNDTSMNRVSAISNTYFDFGGTPNAGGVATPAPDTGTTMVGIDTNGAGG
jgi:hypothetical protein